MLLVTLSVVRIKARKNFHELINKIINYDLEPKL